MNNELKQLCEQAKAYATESTKHFTGDEPVVWMDYYTEKFAELIVKECIQLMEARKYADPNDSAEHYVNQGLATGVSLINQHFGVK